jgi:hypothetical protein
MGRAIRDYFWGAEKCVQGSNKACSKCNTEKKKSGKNKKQKTKPAPAGKEAR